MNRFQKQKTKGFVFTLAALAITIIMLSTFFAISQISFSEYLTTGKNPKMQVFSSAFFEAGIAASISSSPNSTAAFYMDSVIGSIASIHSAPVEDWYIFFSNRSIVVNSDSLPLPKSLSIYPYVPAATDPPINGTLYYPKTNSSADRIYFQITTHLLTYRLEFRLISLLVSPNKIGSIYCLNFTYRTYDNGAYNEEQSLQLRINGSFCPVIKKTADNYIAFFAMPIGNSSLNIVSLDHNGIALACIINMAK